MQKMRQQLLTACIALVLTIGCVSTLSACESPVKPTNSEPVAENPANQVSYTVTLNPNGGTFTDSGSKAIILQVKEGAAIDFAASTPTYEGNTLYGWNQADGSPWPGAKKVVGDISLKAKWSVTDVVATYPLELTINGTDIVLEHDNGVYQFTFVSTIYGGYAQRSGKYTIYTDKLTAAMEADDGSVQRVLYKADSNYVDATGTIYAEFYNDGEFELYYDFTNNGERSKYCMNTGYWNYEGYTAPFESTPIPADETGMGYTSAHTEWDTSLLAEDPSKKGGETGPAAAEISTVPGTVIFTVDAAASETMKANFCDNGVLAIYMTTYSTNVDTKYLWSNTEETGFSITYNGAEENLSVASDTAGEYTFADGFGNSYIITLSALMSATPAAGQIYTAPATASTTMFGFFYSNHTFSLMFDLTAYGQAGQFASQGIGQWNYSEEEGLILTLENQAMELTDAGDGVFHFTANDNTYAITLKEFISGIV